MRETNMPDTLTATIEVDLAAAELIRRAQARATARGETLGDYLQQNLPREVVQPENQVPTQLEAWNAFVAGMTAWGQKNLPPNHVIDDSRDAMYDDRN
jgi:hypothetical protein